MTFFKEIQDYFSDLARKNKLTAHNPPERRTFFRMDNEEDLASVPNDAGSPYVKVLGMNGSMQGEEDSPKRRETFQVRFAAKADPNNNVSDSVEAAQQLAYQVMLQFYNRIVEDSDNDPCGVLKYLQTNGVAWQPVGPVNQFEYGWEMFLPFILKMPAYDAGEWTS